MKRAVSFLLCLCMALTLCVFGGVSAFAEDASPRTDSKDADIESLIKEGRNAYYARGGESFDVEKASELFTKAAELGSGEAWWYLGELAMRTNEDDRFETAMACYKKAVEAGCDLGLLGQGALYENGQGVSRDLERARGFYEQALENGLTEANSAMGDLFYTGRDVRRDFRKALDYYKLALKSDEPGYAADAYARIGRVYASSKDETVKDYDDAIEWFEKGTDAKSSLAQLLLGEMYYYGHGVSEDYVTAKSCFEKAAKMGNPTANFYLGRLYDIGQGVEQN